MATAKGKRPAAKRRVNLAALIQDACTRPVKNSVAAHAMARINAENPTLRKDLLQLLGRSRYRRACNGQRVPVMALEAIEKLTGGQVKRWLWKVPAEGPPLHPYCPRYEP